MGKTGEQTGSILSAIQLYTTTRKQNSLLAWESEASPTYPQNVAQRVVAHVYCNGHEQDTWGYSMCRALLPIVATSVVANTPKFTLQRNHRFTYL